MLFSPLAPHQTLAILHIPKTAGTSLVAQIAQSGAPWAHVLNVRYYPEIQRALGTARDHLIDLKPDVLSGAYRVIFGHMTRRDVIYGLGGAENVRFAAMIRDPVSRFISEYAYATSSKHPDHAAVLNRYPTLDHFIDQCVDNNVLTHYLERYRGQSVQDLVAELSQAFCFIGKSEHLDTEAPQLMSLFSSAPFIQTRLNARLGAPIVVSKETRGRIRELNARDVEFYDLVFGDKATASLSPDGQATGSLAP